MNTLLKTKQDKDEFLTWVAWLIADVLPQGTAQLENITGFCCLGVGYLLTCPIPNTIKIEGGIYLDGPIPGTDAPEWLQFVNEDFRMKTGKTLIHLNDIDFYTFPQIGAELLRVYQSELELIK